MMNRRRTVGQMDRHSKFRRARHFFVAGQNNIGIEHISSCINVCQVSRELLKTEDKGFLEGPGSKRYVSKKCRNTRDITCQLVLFDWIVMMMQLKMMF